MELEEPTNNTRKHWSKDELVTLMKLLKEGKTKAEVGKELQRSDISVYNGRRKLVEWAALNRPDFKIPEFSKATAVINIDLGDEFDDIFNDGAASPEVEGDTVDEPSDAENVLGDLEL